MQKQKLANSVLLFYSAKDHGFLTANLLYVDHLNIIHQNVKFVERNMIKPTVF